MSQQQSSNAPDAWDPAQYDRFREERQQPFYDLLKLVVPRKGMRVIDLGCGTGELTRELHRQLKASSTLGIDSSAAMLASAAELHEDGLRFEQRAIEDAADGPPRHEARDEFDLVLSNAAIHWVADHASLLPKLAQLVAPDGQLAVQMPANHDHPSHTVADVVAREAPFAAALAGSGVQRNVLPVEAYARLLHQLGFRRQHVRMQVYGHRLSSRDGVVEWVKGTTLTDFKRRLGDTLYPQFEARYREELMRVLPDEQPFFYTFKRILFWAEK